MPSALNIENLAETLTQYAYQTFQDSKSAFSLAHKNFSNKLTSFFVTSREKQGKPLGSEIIGEIKRRREQLLERDWQDAQAGVYPSSLLFDNPWNDFFLYYPQIWLDLPQTWQLLSKKEYQVFSPEIDQTGYPSYYLQNFHYQTNGYLSELSANLYDLQVELLFNGVADAMRRRILKPLKEGLAEFREIPSSQIRVLDVACGTGRSLKFIRATLNKASLYGVDLSPTYLRKANQLLLEEAGRLPQLLQANAENLPYVDNYFQAVTSVFLFHELPPAARQNVIAESFRVLSPGGTLVICDAFQKSDSPEFEALMDNFPVIFHEPYFRHYTEDNLEERLTNVGFTDIEINNHFVSKYWVARKPK